MANVSDRREATSGTRRKTASPTIYYSLFLELMLDIIRSTDTKALDKLLRARSTTLAEAEAVVAPDSGGHPAAR